MSSQYHEKDSRWTAVDTYGISHLHPPSAPYHDALISAAKRAKEQALPDIAVSPLQGQFLQLQARFIGAKHILEVGTLGGYSTIWLASTGPEAKVVTVEVDPHHAAVAKESIESAGLGERVEIREGAGVDVLTKLEEEVAAGKREKLDFTFIDADKENNLFYFEKALEISRSGACIIVDNVVRKGAVADEEQAKSDSAIKGSRKVIEAAAKNKRVDATLMQTVGEKNYDGMLICRVK
ncbi:hypothetical protein MMC10_002937 [Thelotrema lepadinum]|nr:hypothetical protein [Thelotrema lepadinum]